MPAGAQEVVHKGYHALAVHGITVMHRDGHLCSAAMGKTVAFFAPLRNAPVVISPHRCPGRFPTGRNVAVRSQCIHHHSIGTSRLQRALPDAPSTHARRLKKCSCGGGLELISERSPPRAHRVFKQPRRHSHQARPKEAESKTSSP